MMTFAGHDAGPRATAIENDFLSTLSVMRSRLPFSDWLVTAGAFLGTWGVTLRPQDLRANVNFESEEHTCQGFVSRDLVFRWTVSAQG
jgi:hypothetical protein